ncbi:hypothetical protein BBO99_00009188 [Phytophthora kernoviae]|uniref:DUF155 domain-containing protein n=3 Tax=Phytophthora kernoviae TaxID=325452 RepID=A0A3R7J2K8_9STRA|nr:hypothetical protein JM16_009081 [Phytophthora kernoviae]RLN73886.1 hypothetical protein BBO99_00009188 [Phytophthora kernoviae]
MSTRGRGHSRSPPQSPEDGKSNLSESSPLLHSGTISLNYNSDSAVYDRKEEENGNGSRRFYGADGSSSDSEENEDFSDLDRQFSPTSYRQPSDFRQIPRANWHGLGWLERVETGQLPGGELHPDGWHHKMYMGAIHSSCAPSPEMAEGATSSMPVPYQQKDAFYFATGCAVFWGLTRAEEQAHLMALGTFSVGPVKQVEVEDMDYMYGDASIICNDAITLSSNRASEKLAVSFAMAQSSKLDVFEERVEDTIRETKHVPQNLAATGSIQYSQSDISKLIGRLFIERSDVNLNSDMLDEPDFFWEDDEYEPLYKKVMKYLSVDNRVQILNTRLDILRELLDVLSQQLAHQHDTKLEMIVIWLIVAEVAVQVVWNILIKDILGFFPHSDNSD